MPLHPRTCSLLYSVSCLLDALDGMAARKFEQSTKFGAVLDMVTDRCTTTCLLVFLASAFPRWSILFQGLISLDLASHYMQMYTTLTMGGSGQSHKKVDERRHGWLMTIYYTNTVCWEEALELGSGMTDKILTDSPVYTMRIERGFLHCGLPPLVLVADTLSSTVTSWSWKLDDTAWESRSALHDLDDTMECRRDGNGKVCLQSSRSQAESELMLTHGQQSEQDG